MGVVYSVVDSEGKRWAMKTLEPGENVLANVDYEHLRARFRREVKSQASLTHPNIAPVFDHSLDADPPYFVMELAQSTLSDDLAEDRTLDGDPASALYDILSALEEIEQRGFVHRDLKPQNVLRFVDEKNARYAISDFGLMTAGIDNSTTLTATGAQGGTVNYAAPELLTNFRGATSKADMYSFGAILHDIFSGEPRIPYTELAAAGKIGEVISTCTKKNPARRYPSIAVLRERLYDALNTEPPSFSSNDEKRAIELLAESEELSEEEWDVVFFALAEAETQGRKAGGICAHIRSDHIHALVDEPELQRGLGLAYCDYAIGSAFDFAYCDVLATNLELFFESDDVELRAFVLVALLELGTSHNRWVVEWKFVRLADEDADDEVIRRFLLELEVRDLELRYLISKLEKSIKANTNQLHHVIVDALGEHFPNS